jgi:hypothetical protein
VLLIVTLFNPLLKNERYYLFKNYLIIILKKKLTNNSKKTFFEKFSSINIYNKNKF